MIGSRPLLFSGTKVCIICEGSEEYDYFDKIISLNVWSDKYDFELVNADGNGNIPARYNERYMSDSYDIVLVFCDTDEKPYESYDEIKRKINFFHGKSGAAEEIIIFANPCTMQVILLHFENIRLKSHRKSDNRPDIKRLTEIGKYGAKKSQRKRLFRMINEQNYREMVGYISKLDSDDKSENSSNFYKFINQFESYNCEWVDSINDFLEN